MAEQKNLFIKSKMNKDLDDRLIPNGEYRNAVNVMVSRSEGQDVGALENVLGNEFISNTIIKDSLGVEVPNLSIIGYGRDEANDRIFLFLTDFTDNSSTGVNNIDTSVGKHYVTVYNTVTFDYTILVSGGFLNFSKNSLITGVNVVENLLFWTDNRNQPRKINVNYALDRPATSTTPYYTAEDHIAVTRYYPFQPIQLWKDEGAPSGIQAQMKSKSIVNNPANPIDAPTANANPTYDASYAGDPEFMKDKFLRFSYRFKYDDDEYSIVAPFTQIAFIPFQDGFFSSYSQNNWVAKKSDEEDAYESSITKLMENKVDSANLIIPLPAQVKDIANEYKIQEIDILYKESDNINIKKIETLKVEDFDSTSTDEFIEYEYLARKSINILPESQTTRASDQAPIRTISQEVVGNRVVYGNFLNRYPHPAEIDYKVNVSEKFPTNTVISPSNPLAETTRISYPNHTLKRNRTYQVGIVLADKWGRQSPVILNGDVTSETISGLQFGSSTITHEYMGDPNHPDPLKAYTGPWKGTPVLDWTGDSIKLLFNSKITVPGLPNDGLYDSVKNPAGWYSYKVVVKQTEQEYYNVYLPGILNGYPIPDFEEYDNQVAHIVLINDNINKVPRDLNEVGPDQRKFRSSVQLYGRVINVPELGGISAPLTPTNFYNSTYNQQYYPDASLPAYVGIPQTSYFENYHTASEIGTFSDLGFGRTLGVNESVVEDVAGGSIQKFPISYAIAPLADTYQKYIYTTNYNPDIEPGMVVSSPYQDRTPVTGTDVSINNINAVVVSNVENQDYDPGAAPAGTMIQNAKGKVLVRFNAVLNPAGIDCALDPANPLFFTWSNLYEAQSNPLIAKIKTKRPIGTSIYQAQSISAGFTSADQSLPITPFLAIYETEPVVSDIDIFWETSTSGLISDLNTAVDTGLSVADGLDWNFSLLESDNIGTSVAIDISALGPLGTPLNNWEITLSSIESVDASGAVINRMSDFNFSNTQPPLPGQPGLYKIDTASFFVYDSDALNNNTQSFKFIFEARDQTAGGYPGVVSFTRYGSLSNINPNVVQSPVNRVSILPNHAAPVALLTGFNGSHNVAANSANYTKDLHWQLVGQTKEITPTTQLTPPLFLLDGTGLNSWERNIVIAPNAQLEPNTSYVVTTVLYDASTAGNFGNAGQVITQTIIDVGTVPFNLPNQNFNYRLYEGGTIYAGWVEDIITDGVGSSLMDKAITPIQLGNHPAMALDGGTTNSNIDSSTEDNCPLLVIQNNSKDIFKENEYKYLRGWAAWPGNRVLHASPHSTWTPPIQTLTKDDEFDCKYPNSQFGIHGCNGPTGGVDGATVRVNYILGALSLSGVSWGSGLSGSKGWNDNKPDNKYLTPAINAVEENDPTYYPYWWGYTGFNALNGTNCFDGTKLGYQNTEVPYTATMFQNFKTVLQNSFAPSDDVFFQPRGYFYVCTNRWYGYAGGTEKMYKETGAMAVTWKMRMWSGIFNPGASAYENYHARSSYWQSHRIDQRQAGTTNAWEELHDSLRNEVFKGGQWDYVGSEVDSDDDYGNPIDSSMYNFSSVLLENEDMSISGSGFDTQYTVVNNGYGNYASWFRGDACYYVGKQDNLPEYSTWNPHKLRRLIRGGGINDQHKWHFYSSDPNISTIRKNQHGIYKWFPYNTSIPQDQISSYDHGNKSLIPALNLGRTIDDYQYAGGVDEFKSAGNKLNNYMAIRHVYGQSNVDSGAGVWYLNPSVGAGASKTMVFDQNDIDFRLMSGNLRKGLGRIQQEAWDTNTDKKTKYYSQNANDMETDVGRMMTNFNKSNVKSTDPETYLAQEMSRGTIEVVDYYNSQPNPAGGFFGWYEYLVVDTLISGNDLKTVYDPSAMGDKTNFWNYGNYGFNSDYNPITSAGGIGGSWTRKWSKEPCFGYVKHFYDFDPATQEFTIWKPAGIANSGYILYTQPIAAWKWDLLDEVKIPNTTGSYGLLTDDPNFPTTNAGTRLVGYPFGTNYSFGPKKRDPATGSTYAGRGVWPMWFAYMSTYDVKYIDSIDTYTDLPTKPQPFAVKTTFN